jgi:peptidoglycan/LPS O-acetylase OafA/YrhL
MMLTERFAALSNRGPSFDLIRLVAATIVLLHHSQFSEHTDIRLDPLFYFSHGYIHFGFLAVAVFFAMSGFLVTPGLVRSGNVIEFAAGRIARVFPALVIVVVATMFIVGPILTTSTLKNYFIDPLFYRYAKNITTSLSNNLPGVSFKDGAPVVINMALWTLQFEIMCYAALALLSVFSALRRRSIYLVLFLVCFAIHASLWFFPNLTAILPDRFVIFVNLFVYFAAGAMLFIFGDKIPFSFALTTIVVFLMLLALPLGLGAIALPIGIPYTIVYFGLSNLPGGFVLKADCSYGIYLFHSPVLIFLLVVFPNIYPWWLVSLAVFLITIILAYTSWTFIEKPSLKRKRVVSSFLAHMTSSIRDIFIREVPGNP